MQACIRIAASWLARTWLAINHNYFIHIHASLIVTRPPIGSVSVVGYAPVPTEVPTEPPPVNSGKLPDR